MNKFNVGDRVVTTTNSCEGTIIHAYEDGLTVDVKFDGITAPTWVRCEHLRKTAKLFEVGDKVKVKILGAVATETGEIIAESGYGLSGPHVYTVSTPSGSLLRGLEASNLELIKEPEKPFWSASYVDKPKKPYLLRSGTDNPHQTYFAGHPDIIDYFLLCAEIDEAVDRATVDYDPELPGYLTWERAL